MGGMQGFGPVVTADGDATHHETWEIRAQVITLLAGRSMRDAIERLEPATYLASSYYERWLRAGEMKLVERGEIGTDDLARWRDRIADDPDAAPAPTSDPTMVELIRTMGPGSFGPAPAAAFGVGDRVSVTRMRPDGHHRCPRYIRGAVGTVERTIGTDVVPGTPHAEQVIEPVYTVAFSSTDLFGDQTEHGEPPYAVLIDLCERYLDAP
jgi:nitrile hydratase